MAPRAASDVYQLKISLRGSSPSIWRRVLVPSAVTLDRLHAIVQRTFAWDDSHLHEFRVAKTRYGAVGPEEFDRDVHDERAVCLHDVATRRGAKLEYEYDFGDSWVHDIVVEKVLPATDADLPVCVAGARAAPPEDSGGVWGYEDKLAILADPSDEEHEEIRAWMGDDFAPEAFHLVAINKRLRALAPSRKRAKKRSTTARAKR